MWRDFRKTLRAPPPPSQFALPQCKPANPKVAGLHFASLIAQAYGAQPYRTSCSSVLPRHEAPLAIPPVNSSRICVIEDL